MKTLYFYDEKYEAEKIVKTDSDILGYDNNRILVWSFRGINDFSKFKLEEGQQFDLQDISVDELSQALANSQVKIMEQQQALDSALQLIADLQIQLAGGNI